MKTIEERAKEYAPIEEGDLDGFSNEQIYKVTEWIDQSYIYGETDQKAIDDEEYRKDMRYVATKRAELIDKMCDLMITAVNEGLIETSDVGKLNMWLREKLK